jgi:hypothetical protein
MHQNKEPQEPGNKRHMALIPEDLSTKLMKDPKLTDDR